MVEECLAGSRLELAGDSISGPVLACLDSGSGRRKRHLHSSQIA